MKILAIYDTNYGNTKIIAEAIGSELGKNSKILKVDALDMKELNNLDLLIVGSPIIGWKPSEKMGQFLISLKKEQLKGIKAVSFDTRVSLFIHGDATKKISQKLEEAGATIVSEPHFFYVKGAQGPLADGEIEKAKKWARELQNICL